MKSLIVVRPNAAAKRGGDVAVAEHTAAALRSHGVEADVVATLNPDARGYDVAHVLGIFEPDFARPQIAALRAQGVPVAVSPTWLDRTSFFLMEPKVRRALSERDASRATRRVAALRDDEDRLSRRPGRGALRRRDEQARLLRACDLALPESEIEAWLCANVLRPGSMPIAVVRLGVEAAAFAPRDPGERAGVVCVGRIEPLKNQAMLLFALRDADVDVTLVGGTHNAEYLALCRRWATPRTRFVERLGEDEMGALLARTAVHALPSWGDLPGFVSLEAACAGARVVAGTRGSEREYLGPDAEYVDPMDPDGIRDAVVRAIRRGPRVRYDALDERMRGFTWERTAAATADAYARAIAERPRPS